jgi:hypothetical protein
MTSVAMAALLLSLSACGGSDDDKPETKPTATTSATPTEAPQPKGDYGVTLDIVNWDAHSEDPAVLAWKRFMEASGGSTNQGKLLPVLRHSVSKPVLRQVVAAFNQSEKYDLHLRPVGNVKVASAKTSGSTARLTMCLWGPSNGYYKKNGAYWGKPEVFWFKQQAVLKSSGDKWIVSSYAYKGKCSGGAPA